MNFQRNPTACSKFDIIIIIYGLFNDSVNSSDYIAFSYSMING
jgi:hypothetical protein